MRIKKIKIGIKDLKTALRGFAERADAIERGETVKKETGVYFTSFEAFRKILTPKRLELLHIIKIQKPSSINELARMAKRDVKNVADDVKYLEQIGLIEKKETDNKTAPVTKYDRIALEIAV
jgi:predicted transcriptional regulator